MELIIWKIFIFIFVIGVLVFVHELGHFLLAKYCGVGVIKFSVGFGPSILKFKRGETTYQIGCIPLGGFVRMVGDMPDAITGEQETDELVKRAEELEDELGEELTEEEKALMADKSRWFIEKSLLQRTSIVFAGPLFNFIFAFLAVGVGIFVYGETRLDESSRIGSVHPDSPAFRAGIQKDDRIVQINGDPISKWEDLAKSINSNRDKEIQIKIARNGEELDFSVAPQKQIVPSLFGKPTERFLIGVGYAEIKNEVGILTSFKKGLVWTANMTLLTYRGLWGMITGQVSPKDLAGPKLIFDEAGRQAKKGFENLLYFIAMLSVSLAVLNLLPIPVLDGGHLLIFLIEAIFGPIAIRKKEFAQGIGMLFLISLMVFALHNDFTRENKTLENKFKWEKQDAE